MMNDVFISHSSLDKAMVIDIMNYVESRGISCWLSSRDICGGTHYPEEIVAKIKECRIVLLIVSENVIKNPKHVLNEVEIAISHCKIILPFKIDKVDYTDSFRYYLDRKHRIEALPDPEDYFEELVASLSYLLTRAEGNLDTEDDARLIAIRGRNRRRLINSTKEQRLSFGLSILSDSPSDEWHFYKSIKRIDIIDTANLKYSNYRWMEIMNQSNHPTSYIVHKECGENKVRFEHMSFSARQYIDGKSVALHVDSETTVQPNFEQLIKVHFNKPLASGESAKLFYRLDWPGEPGAYCDQLSTSISLVRYAKGVKKLVFGIMDTAELYGFELLQVNSNFEIKPEGATVKEMTVDLDPDLKPLHGRVNAKGAYFEIEDATDNVSYIISYKQRNQNNVISEDEGF